LRGHDRGGDRTRAGDQRRHREEPMRPGPFHAAPTARRRGHRTREHQCIDGTGVSTRTARPAPGRTAPATAPPQRGSARTGTESVMGLLEEALRETLSAKVAAMPTIDGQADRAIRAAGRIRSRRAVGFTASAVVGVLAVTLSVGLATTYVGRGNQNGTTSLNLTAPVVPLSAGTQAYLLTGGEIVGPNGTVVSLHGQLATRAWRLASAFLVESPATVSLGVLLWHVPVSGVRTELLQADDIVV